MSGAFCLGNDDRAAALVRAVCAARVAAFGARVASWGVGPAAVPAVVAGRCARVLVADPSEVVPGYKRGHPLPPDALLRGYIAKFAEFTETPRVRDIPSAFEVLSKLEIDEGDRFRAYAKRSLRNQMAADQVVCIAFDEVRDYHLNPDLEAAAVTLAATHEVPDMLLAPLRGYLWQTVRRRIIDAARRPKEHSGGRERGAVVDFDTKLRIADLDKAVDINPEITPDERRYWKWKMKDPDAPDNQFPGGFTSVQISRIKASLARKLMAWEHQRTRLAGVGGIR